MKQIILLLIAITLSNYANSQYKYDGSTITLVSPQSATMIWENDSIKFEFEPTDYFWEVKINNKMGVNIICLWDETLFIDFDESSQIVFDNTSRLSMDQPKGTSIIAPDTYIKKEIFPKENISTYNIHPVFSKKYGADIKLVFPIMIGEFKKTYEFKFDVTPPPPKPSKVKKKRDKKEKR